MQVKKEMTSGVSSGQVTADQVTVVTVTYGTRAAILQRTLAACAAQGVKHAVVVDNASPGETVASVLRASAMRIERIRLERNLGSAGGYASGIERALAAGAQYIWLLDDDNIPEQDCIEELLAAWRIAS